MKRTLAAADLVLVSPGIVFFSALFLRNFMPASDPANGPQQVVMWYAGRHWTLWTLLIALPLIALALGGASLLRTWKRDVSLRADSSRVLSAVRAHLPVLITGLATLSAGIVLVLVALHMTAN